MKPAVWLSIVPFQSTCRMCFVCSCHKSPCRLLLQLSLVLLKCSFREAFHFPHHAQLSSPWKTCNVCCRDSRLNYVEQHSDPPGAGRRAP